jgi:hypothetical protein
VKAIVVEWCVLTKAISPNRDLDQTSDDARQEFSQISPSRIKEPYVQLQNPARITILFSEIYGI